MLHRLLAGNLFMLLILVKWYGVFCDRDSEGNEELPAGGF